MGVGSKSAHHTTRPAPRRRIAGVLIVAIVLALGAVASPAVAKGKRGHRGEANPTKAIRASAAQLRGVNLTPMQAFMPGGQSDADNQREVQSACLMGADVVRVFVMWYMLEPSRGQVDPAYVSKLDSLVSQANACGTRVMFMLAATPPWDSSAPDGTGFPQSGTFAPRDGEFGWMVSWILRRWPSLQSIEVWNEPNYGPYWSSTPADYAALVNAAVAAKREAGSSTLILGGAIASGDVTYLDQAYAAGMQGQDGISIHPYSMYCSGACTLTDPTPAGAPFRLAITAVHDLMLSHGDHSGLWLTEFGFATCPAAGSCVSEPQQAQWMAKSVRMASCYPYVRGLTPFTIRDIPAADPAYDLVQDAHFGLLHKDFSPKPSFAAMTAAYKDYGLKKRPGSGSRARQKAVARMALPGSKTCRRLLGSAEARKALTR
jgi:hypothetical protein